MRLSILLRQDVLLHPAALAAAALLAVPLAARAQLDLPGVKGDSNRPACKLLSAAEIQKLTGDAGYKENPFGDDVGEGAGGGSSCNYGGSTMLAQGPPMLSVVLVPPGKNGRYFDIRRRGKMLPGCKQEPVSGVGKDAYFEICPKQSELPLFVKGPGTDDLIVALKLDAKDADVSSLKKTLVTVASAAAAKLK
ncbi:MAG TPA: hypothetical protein VFK85_08045 [Anaeromyxobacteraceae bacterium]|nr:hypothetical protein [Anaeromyxobacteraceae bacterium]